MPKKPKNADPSKKKASKNTEEAVAEPKLYTQRSDAELKKIAADMVNGLIYADFMVPWIPEGQSDRPMVIHVANSGPIITAKEMLNKAKHTHGRPGMKPDRATISTLFPALMLAEEDVTDTWRRWNIVAIFQYADKMVHGGRIINKLPQFFSFEVVSSAEFHKLKNYMIEYENIQREYLGSPEEESFNLPATCSFRYNDPLSDGTIRMTYLEFPVRALAADGYTLLTGYRDGVNQNENISFGASYCKISAIWVDDDKPGVKGEGKPEASEEDEGLSEEDLLDDEEE